MYGNGAGKGLGFGLGFNLIGLLVVIAILGVSVALSFSAFDGGTTGLTAGTLSGVTSTTATGTATPTATGATTVTGTTTGTAPAATTAVARAVAVAACNSDATEVETAARRTPPCTAVPRRDAGAALALPPGLPVQPGLLDLRRLGCRDGRRTEDGHARGLRRSGCVRPGGDLRLSLPSGLIDAGLLPAGLPPAGLLDPPECVRRVGAGEIDQGEGDPGLGGQLLHRLQILVEVAGVVLHGPGELVHGAGRHPQPL